ncbi:MAG: carbamoyl phosphate synthase small subunit, partial [Candidatus Omnitrophica bacterium]|nr:carbamoyl phosphate synthase small subunit [Candidatus Omnitrophota bacterium]
RLGRSLVILPYSTTAKEILKQKATGLIICGGPEEDPGLEGVVAEVKNLIGKIPIMGISTGCKVLAQALGAKVIKMKLGHHGLNYPIYTPGSYKAEITTQNHSWMIDPDTLSKIKNIKIIAYNLNDRSIEEIESKKLKLLGVEYYPLSPGFNEIHPAFKKFIKILNAVR